MFCVALLKHRLVEPLCVLISLVVSPILLNILALRLAVLKLLPQITDATMQIRIYMTKTKPANQTGLENVNHLRKSRINGEVGDYNFFLMKTVKLTLSR